VGRPSNRFYGSAANPPVGTRPARPGKAPPLRPGATCFENARPDLNGPAGRKAASDQVIEKQK